MVPIILISAVTFNSTLLQVNHVTTDTSDLCLNLLCSRREFQTGIWKSRPHKPFMSMDPQVSLGKSSCCGINFLFLWEAVSFITQWQKEKAIRAEGSGDFYVFPTSLFCALKQDQMFQRWNETQVTLHLICGTTLTWNASSSFQGLKNDVHNKQDKKGEHSFKKAINYKIHRQYANAFQVNTEKCRLFA